MARTEGGNAMETKIRSNSISRPNSRRKARNHGRSKQTDLERIIAEQGVKPLKFDDLWGKWPGELNDGFEEALRRWRQEDSPRSKER